MPMYHILYIFFCMSDTLFFIPDRCYVCTLILFFVLYDVHNTQSNTLLLFTVCTSVE